MQFFVVLLGFLVVVVLLAGVVASLMGYDIFGTETTAWPVLAEAEHSHEIHNLKGVLEQEDVPVMVEEDSSEAGGLPTTLTRNLLRVPPGQQNRALELIRNSEINTEDLRIRAGGENSS